ncbi:hypothetical protein DFH29DRAFT_940230 [Suillus ampliporus]|nr:hypothetical protein DFH29DRAFT_940230 [Suillus ampliporus]
MLWCVYIYIVQGGASATYMWGLYYTGTFDMTTSFCQLRHQIHPSRLFSLLDRRCHVPGAISISPRLVKSRCSHCFARLTYFLCWHHRP